MSKPLTNTSGCDYASDEHKKADTAFVLAQVLRSIEMGHAEGSWRVVDSRVTGCKVTQGFVNKI